MSIRSTAKAIIVKDGKILLNKCYGNAFGDYFSLPGGGQNQHESLEEAVVRECLEENVQKLCEIGTPHAKECIESSPYRHRGWIEYRVLETKNVEEAKLFVQIRVSGKQTSIG